MRSYEIGDDRPCQLNEIFCSLLAYSIKMEDSNLNFNLMEILKKYFLVFFFENNSHSVISHEQVRTLEVAEFKSLISASYRMFEESYFYYKDVKQMVVGVLSTRFLSQFEVPSFQKALVASKDFSSNYLQLEFMISQLCNFGYIAAACFLSNMNAEEDLDDNIAFMMVKTSINSEERSLLYAQEGLIIVTLIKFFQLIESLLITDQLELFLDVNLSNKNKVVIHFKFCFMYLLEKIYDTVIHQVSLSPNWEDPGQAIKIYTDSLIVQNIIAHQAMFPQNLEGLFIYMSEYCFKNVGDKYSNISKYAFKLLTKLILVKNKVNRACFKTLQFLAFVQNNIFTALPQTELSKESMAKRQNLFESIGHCFLSDIHDEYISNARLIIDKVFNQIQSNTTYQSEMTILLIFQDIIGLVKAISNSDVLLAFMRVGYPRICELLKRIDQEQLIGKDSFLQAVTSFHYYLTLNILDKSHSSQEMTIQILRNTLLLLGNLSARVRRGLESQPANKQAELLKDNIGVLSKLFKTFKLFMKKGAQVVSYSVFHFFKDFTFLEYLHSSLDLIFFYVNFEHV